MSFGVPVRNGLAIGLLSSTTLSSNGGLFPAMALNFLQPFLDSRITFTRGSNATLVDSTGKITYAPANLVFNSADVTNASWNKLSGGTAASATTFNFTSTFGSGFENQTAVTLAAGTNVVASFFASGSGTIQIGIVDGSGAFGSTFTTVVLTGTLTRYSVSRTLVDANALLRVRNTSGVAVTGATCTQMQLEPVTYQTAPGTYNATTTAAYYGPRFDYDPVTLAAKGLLIEEARTNIMLQSQALETTWTRGNILAFGSGSVVNAIAAPDGTTSAEFIVPDTTGGVAHFMAQSVSHTAASYTISAYVKAGAYTKFAFRENTTLGTYATFNVSTGTVIETNGTATIQNAGNGWYRCTLTYTGAAVSQAMGLYVLHAAYTSGSPHLYFWAGDGTSGLYMWGVQDELGSFATSYIPTVASQVTRSADVATMTGTNFSSWYNSVQGTFAVGFTSNGFTSNAMIFSVTDGTLTNLIQSYWSAATTITMDGGALATMTLTAAQNTASTLAYAYKLNDYAAVINGGSVTTDTSGTPPSTMSQLNISNRNGSLFGNGHIRSIAYYNTRLTNATLQALTAPPLVTTLSMSFTDQAYTVGV